MRYETTLPSLDNLWRFLIEIDQRMRKSGLNMDIKLLFYDVNYRGSLNKLINDLERTFRDSMNVREAWNNLRLQYGQLGKTLYGLAATAGIVGYSLIIVSSQSVTLLSEQQLSWLWILPVIVVALFLGLMLHIQGRIHSNVRIYQEAKERYLIDEVRLEK